MRTAVFIAVMLLATPALAQYPYQQPPNLSDAYQRSLRTINPPQPPSYDVQSGPYGNVYANPRPGTDGPSITCRAGPFATIEEARAAWALLMMPAEGNA